MERKSFENISLDNSTTVDLLGSSRVNQKLIINF
jgi:hypothetical protein